MFLGFLMFIGRVNGFDKIFPKFAEPRGGLGTANL